jgi:5-methylcytosine-specific restriction endonuclease McrA
MSVLERPALVLNRNWQAIHVTTVVRALVMAWSETAKIVDSETYVLWSWDEWCGREPASDAPCIRTAHARLAVPEVVSLVHYERLPSASVSFSRRNVAKRDRYACQYCGTRPGVSAITIDHVVPRAQGGVSNWTNCVAACPRCNARKADRTPDQAGMRLRSRPDRPRWKPLYTARGAGIASWARFLTASEPALALA